MALSPTTGISLDCTTTAGTCLVSPVDRTLKQDYNFQISLSGNGGWTYTTATTFALKVKCIGLPLEFIIPPSNPVLTTAYNFLKGNASFPSE